MPLLKHPLVLKILKLGYTTKAEIEHIIEEKKIGQNPGKLNIEDLLMELKKQKIISKEKLLYSISKTYFLELIKLENFPPSAEALKQIKTAIIKEFSILPLKIENKILTVAIYSPNVFEMIHSLENKIGLSIQLKLCEEEELKSLIDNIFKINQSKNRDNKTEEQNKINTTNNIGYLVEDIIHIAIQKTASDIHFEPQKNTFRIRLRCDGKLQTLKDLDNSLHPSIISRIKVMAKLPIDEKRQAQDGKIQFQQKNTNIDLRISCIPTIYGESIVIRILNQHTINALKLDYIGIQELKLKKLKQYLRNNEGFILSTGPTGSGKSTTLYACLQYLNNKSNKLITIEDPVEYRIQGINQVSVKKECGFSFSTALRAILRQSPNTIMIGEIRDLESAEIAINASLTGHLVLSSLHTNNALDSIIRLKEMGIAPYLIAASLKIIMAQRLIPKLCPHCNALEKNASDPLSKKPSRPIGPTCTYCDSKGYKGRIAVFEFLEINKEIQNLIHNSASRNTILEAAKNNNFRGLKAEALYLVAQGLCSLKDVRALSY